LSAEQNELPRAKIVDGKLCVEGEKNVFVQGAIRDLWLEVDQLRYHRAFLIGDEQATRDARISGTAKIRRDRVAIAGARLPSVTEVSFVVWSIAAFEHDYRPWEIHFGFLSGDWEMGSKDEFFCECYIPQDAFDELVAAYRTGAVETLSIHCRTNLWIEDADWYVPPSHYVTWYLAPSQDGKSSMPDVAVGKIGGFRWSEFAFGQSRKNPTDKMT
jgi:hypothetical protein